MKKEWIKFADQLPEVGQYIWTSSTEAPAVSWPFAAGLHLGPYTHWMPCDRPDRPSPDKAPEELAMEEYVKNNPTIPPFCVCVWYAAIKWERERKK